MNILTFPGSGKQLDLYRRGFVALGHKVDVWPADKRPEVMDLESYDMLLGYEDRAYIKPDADYEMSICMGCQLGIPTVLYYDRDEIGEIPISSTYVFHYREGRAKAWTREWAAEGTKCMHIQSGNPAEAAQKMLDIVMPDHYVRMATDRSQDADYKAFVIGEMTKKGEWTQPFQMMYDKESGQPSHVITKPRCTIDRFGNVMKSDLAVGNPYFKNGNIRFTSEIDNMERRVAEWKVVLDQNAPAMDSYIASGDSKDFAPNEDVLYVVAPGPSLKYNGHHLADVKRGKVLCVNKAHNVIGPKNCDYYMALDAKSPESWFQSDLSDTIGYLGACVAPWAQKAKFKQTHWFVDQNLSHLDTVLGPRKEKLPSLDHGMSVLYSATDLAIRMGVKTIVFVGVDGSFRDNEVHPGESVESWGFGDIQKVKNIYGEEVYTNQLYASLTSHLLGKLAFMMIYKVRVINATEGGVLSASINHKGDRFAIEQRRLADVIQELN